MQTATNPVRAVGDGVSLSSAIVEVVELVKELEAQGRQPTGEEEVKLASWMGWGAAAPAFESDAEGAWAQARARLLLLLGPDGASAASAATPTSYFTDRVLAETLWALATRLGFNGGRVLEPGCGSGAIMAASPRDLAIQFTGIEREPFSAAVARLRFPDATILMSALEKVSLVEDSFDLVIGNVPFGQIYLYDRECRMQFALHNYFLFRSLSALRPGGLAVLLTSRYTLDARRDMQRSELRKRGILLGAIRLPTGALSSSGTQVVTDILVFQRPSLDLAWKGQPWMDVSDDIVPGVRVNEYFAQCPQHLVGTFVAERGAYRDDELRVVPPQDVQGALEAAVDDLVGIATTNGGIYLPAPDITQISPTLVRRREDGRREGSYHLLGGRLYQVVDGELKAVSRYVNELTQLVWLRDAASKLLEAELDLDRPDADLIPLRETLNACYERYVREFGPIHRATLIKSEPDTEDGEQRISRRRPPALSAFSRDPDYALVLGLEHYDDSTQRAYKAQIFHNRVHVRIQRKEVADSPAEALALCLDECGTIDMGVIARLLGLDVAEVPARLGELVYEDPRGADTWIVAAEYLAGNVRLKLEEASRAAEASPERYARNVAALRAVLPEDLEPEEIRAILGASWIPPSDIAQFCQETFGTRPNVSYEYLTSTWEVTLPPYTPVSPAATSQWGTRRMDAYRLLEHGLNKSVPVVYDERSDSRVRDVEETLAAQDKLSSIQARFSEWVWEDDERAKRLAAKYNLLFNSVVPRSYDGSHLSFPGMSQTWIDNLYSWQRDFVWRMATSRSGLAGYPVGSGKTLIEIAGAMTLRRLGLITRAAIVVPNHLLEQITAEAQRLYPGARVLMISRDDLTRERRKLFAARVALGDYDFVVMTHASLGALGVHPDTEREYLERRIAIYRQALLDLDEEDKRRRKRSVKRLETVIEKMRQRQRYLLSRPRDDGITFEQLGVSYLIIDEAHLYKNLGLPTNIQGLQVQPAQRAVDLEMKLRWLEEHNQGRPFGSFFTATPYANSMVEAFVMLWYLDQGLLESNGLYSVDAFASIFIELQSRVEVSPNGASFRLYTRPTRFVNMPEFLSLFAQTADLRGPEILDEKRPQRREHTISMEPTAALVAFVDDLVERSELIHQGRPREMGGGRLDNMLWITSHGREAALDLSLVGFPEEKSPKLEAVASTMLEVYRRCQEEMSHLSGEFKSLQIGFCDLGTPNKESEQVYGKLKKLLVEGGMPAHGIRYMHDAKDDTAKAHLFAQCRSGEVAILLASTKLLGVGTNIQLRCAAIHHIDAPWRPDEVEQREGRGHRPGNLFDTVHIYRYTISRSFDAYNWQTLTTKAVPFDQLRRGKLSGREFDAMGETALSYAQVKAAATGDPLVLEQAELDVQIARLQRLQVAHNRARRRDAQDAENKRYSALKSQERAGALRELVRKVASAPTQGFTTLAGLPLAKKADIGDLIAELVQELLFERGGRRLVGSWSGLDVAVSVRVWEMSYAVTLSLGDDVLLIGAHESWMAAKARWRFADAIMQELAGAKDVAANEEAFAQRAIAQAVQLEAQARVPFVHEQELWARLSRKAALDAYATLVAMAKADPTQQDGLLAMREQLLRDTPDFTLVAASAEPAEPSRWAGGGGWKIDIPAVDSLEAVSLFADLLPMLANGETQSRVRRRSRRRQRISARSNGAANGYERLSLFPEEATVDTGSEG
jgi:N12 class adenine-specific DNA methylase